MRHMTCAFVPKRWLECTEMYRTSGLPGSLRHLLTSLDISWHLLTFFVLPRIPRILAQIFWDSLRFPPKPGCIIPVFVLSSAIFVSFQLCDLYGIALAALGMCLDRIWKHNETHERECGAFQTICLQDSSLLCCTRESSFVLISSQSAPHHTQRRSVSLSDMKWFELREFIIWYLLKG